MHNGSICKLPQPCSLPPSLCPAPDPLISAPPSLLSPSSPPASLQPALETPPPPLPSQRQRERREWQREGRERLAM
eukprot:2287687-Rhodomonas_salina.1